MLDGTRLFGNHRVGKVDHAHERKGSKHWECGSLSAVTSQKNWLSVRYQRGDVSTRYDICCVTKRWL